MSSSVILTMDQISGIVIPDGVSTGLFFDSFPSRGDGSQRFFVHDGTDTTVTPSDRSIPTCQPKDDQRARRRDDYCHGDLFRRGCAHLFVVFPILLRGG